LIYASTNRIPDADYSLEGGDIYAYAVDGDTIKQLTSRKGPDTNPVSSPDGKKILYCRSRLEVQSYTVNHLYVMNADGSNPVNLTPKLDRDVPRRNALGRQDHLLHDRRPRRIAALLDPGRGRRARSVDSGLHRLGGGQAGGFSMANNTVVGHHPDVPAGAR